MSQQSSKKIDEAATAGQANYETYRCPAITTLRQPRLARTILSEGRKISNDVDDKTIRCRIKKLPNVQSGENLVRFNRAVEKRLICCAHLRQTPYNQLGNCPYCRLRGMQFIGLPATSPGPPRWDWFFFGTIEVIRKLVRHAVIHNSFYLEAPAVRNLSLRTTSFFANGLIYPDI